MSRKSSLIRYPVLLRRTAEYQAKFIEKQKEKEAKLKKDKKSK